MQPACPCPAYLAQPHVVSQDAAASILGVLHNSQHHRGALQQCEMTTAIRAAPRAATGAALMQPPVQRQRAKQRAKSSSGSNRSRGAAAAAATHGFKVQHQGVPHELQALPLVWLQALQRGKKERGDGREGGGLFGHCWAAG